MAVRPRRHPLAEGRRLSAPVSSGLLSQVGAVAAPLMVKNAIDRGVLARDHGQLLIWLGAPAWRWACSR